MLRRARAIQHRAAQALASYGAHHPTARLWLAVAARVAARAWEAGHPVADVHPAPSSNSPQAELADHDG